MKPLEEQIKREVDLFSKADSKSLTLKVMASMRTISENVKTKKGPLRFNSACIAYMMSPIFVKPGEQTDSRDLASVFEDANFLKAVDKLLTTVCQEAEAALVSGPYERGQVKEMETVKQGEVQTSENEDEAQTSKASNNLRLLFFKLKLFEMVNDQVIDLAWHNNESTAISKLLKAMTNVVIDFAHPDVFGQTQANAFRSRARQAMVVIENVEGEDLKALKSLRISYDFSEAVRALVTSFPQLKDIASMLSSFIDQIL